MPMTPKLILLLALVLLTVRQAVVERIAAAVDADWMNRRRETVVRWFVELSNGISSVYLRLIRGQSRICRTFCVSNLN